MVSPLGACLLNVLLVGLATGAPHHTEEELTQMYDRFRRQFRTWEAPAEEVARRFSAFKINVARAYRLNLEQGINCTDLFDDKACVFGITKFADMFGDEFAATRKGYRRTTDLVDAPVLSLGENLSSAASVDWRKKAITPVKDQGQCGSCWAFSATEQIESAYYMSTGQLKELSTQQIISCDHTDQGCDGGDTPTAYSYVEKAGGIDTASDYPDRSHNTGRTGRCKWDGDKTVKVSGFTYATKPCNKGACRFQNEKKLAAATAAKGPVSICVNAGDWDLYKRGVYSKRCSGASSDLDHCVQLVGYDTTSSPPYWIVRNSWNTDWGEDGFMRLEMGKNLCGVADEATLVEVAKADAAPVVV